MGPKIANQTKARTIAQHDLLFIQTLPACVWDDRLSYAQKSSLFYQECQPSVARLVANLNDRKAKLTTKRATYVEILLHPQSATVTKDTSQDYLKEVVSKLNDIEIFLVNLDVALLSCNEYSKSLREHAECWRKVESGEEQISNAEKVNREFRFNVMSGFIWSQFIHFGDLVNGVPREHLS
ncbi:hypothetical protein EPUS_06866 [Endocarpon pusillum Z07020]|uniref:Uncharacterized protein n=1 Tax=Endocarpon pusillum (strain Z07020 / HMAS-L-300199) TaxID=1263415 RepID=U1GWX0_ENDPU|nr:uncharacterized protein EPUS_06866 [Endocarpon pusillum Z07020]ERF76998.1 hypothetical protein EPUS_06866 [Endocarpon pusillum Z07020]